MRRRRRLVLPLAEIELRAARSSGPGGQHANTTESRVEASFDVAASATLSEEQKARVAARLGPRVTATAQDTRSQLRNRELALDRLAARLAHALEVPRPRTATRPTAASRRRRVEGKRRRGEVKRARRRDRGGEE
jgi:ribosome-associated protein